MTAFLVYFPSASAELAEPILRGAQSFLEAHGTVERDSFGSFARSGRRSGMLEHLALVRFATETTLSFEDAAMRARSLEDVLRTTLKSTGLFVGDVRVFVERE